MEIYVPFFVISKIIKLGAAIHILFFYFYQKRRDENSPYKMILYE